MRGGERVAPPVEIPRPRGRGLIEAGQAARNPQRANQFHDRAVVASLKRLSARTLGWDAAKIPRPRGRGLIEA